MSKNWQALATGAVRERAVHRPRRRRCLAAAVLCLGLSGLVPSSAFAATLEGAVLTTETGVNSEMRINGSGICPGAFSFDAKGVVLADGVGAVGTFVETGSFTVEAPLVTAFRATFTITLDSGEIVTGSKTSDAPGAGSCGSASGITCANNLSISAQWSADNGERGTSQVTLSGCDRGPGGATGGNIFDEGPFVVTAGAAPGPTSKEQCKNGGFAEFGFQNQGQCQKAVKDSAPEPRGVAA